MNTVYSDLILFILLADWEGCQCSPESSWPPLRHVRPQQCQADCRRDAELPGDSWLLHQRGNGVCVSSSLLSLLSQRSLLKWVTIVSVGTEGGHLGREICSRLLLVCGHHSEPNPHCWGLRQWGSVVPRHPDRHQPWRCAGICSQDSLWGEWHQMFTSCPEI